MIFKALPNEQTGCIAYLVGCGTEGVAALIDPGRAEIEDYLALAQAKGVTLTHVIDTHLHADHVSGNRELAERTGATVCLHEAAGVRYPHTPLADGSTVTLGSVRLRVQHTPGHTPDSICLLVEDTRRASVPWFVLTGDTLFVGDIGRVDLGGEEGAANLYDSLFQRLLTLDDSVEVYPAHGAGSSCGKAMSAKGGSTIGFERRFNPALQVKEKEAFVQALLAETMAKPAGFEQIIAKNRGLLPLRRPTVPRLSPRELPRLMEQGVSVVDLREPPAFGEGHLAGSISVWVDGPPFERIAFAVPPDRPLALIAQNDGELQRALAGLSRLGFDDIAGCVMTSSPATDAGGRPAHLPHITPVELRERLSREPDLFVLDVRDRSEWAEGHIEGAYHLPLRELGEHFQEIPMNRTLAVICGRGPRGATAASLLLQRGWRDLVNVWGGMSLWRRSGFPMVTGV